jgi:hypothetical protein
MFVCIYGGFNIQRAGNEDSFHQNTSYHNKFAVSFNPPEDDDLIRQKLVLKLTVTERNVLC